MVTKNNKNLLTCKIYQKPCSEGFYSFIKMKRAEFPNFISNYTRVSLTRLKFITIPFIKFVHFVQRVCPIRNNLLRKKQQLQSYKNYTFKLLGQRHFQNEKGK